MASRLTCSNSRLPYVAAISIRRLATQIGSSFVMAVAVIASMGIYCQQKSLGAESVVVQLKNGRLLSGEVDDRTNESELWIRSVEPSIVLATSVPWTDLKAVQVQAKSVTPEAFRQTAKQLMTRAPVVPFRQPVIPADRQARKNIASPATSMDIVPSLANSTLDREADGVALRVSAMTASGEPVPIDGIITVQILAQRVVSNDRLESRSGLGFWSGAAGVRETRTTIDTRAYVEVGRWSERLRKRDVGSGGYYHLHLPFRNMNPESELDLTLDAQVDAKLAVLGGDILYATSPLQLREFSRLREDLQLDRGTRLFPTELLTH